MNLALDRSTLADGMRLALARRSVHALGRYLIPDYADGWMCRVLGETLTRVSDQILAKRSPRLLVTMPPQHGKSLHCGVLLPLLHLGRAPHHRIVVASYGLDLAKDIAKASRDLVLGGMVAPVFPRLGVSPDTRSKADWRTREGGGVKSVGVGGPLVGRSAELIVIDDPFKNHRSAMSPLARADVQAWYQTAARTRVQQGGGIIAVHTRWHEDDLIGYLLEHCAHEGWDHLYFPAIATEDEAHRRAGEPLHTGRYSLEALEQIRSSLNPSWWSAVYQGNPTSETGEVWREEAWRYWTIGPPTPEQVSAGYVQRPRSFRRVVVSADLTFGSRSSASSFAVLQAWGETRGGELFLLDEQRGQWPYPEQRSRLVRFSKRVGAARVLVEYAAHGVAIVQELKGSVRGLEAVRVTTDKVSRAEAAAPRINEGRVFLPANAPWLAAWLAEVTAFPTHRYDDRVDAAGMVIRMLDDATGVNFMF